MQPKLKRIAAAQGGVFTTDQARRCGYSDREIRSLRSTGTWTALRRGIYAEATEADGGDDLPPYRLQVAAALLAIGPHAVASHQSAAALWGFETLQPLETPVVRLTTSTGRTPRRYPGLRVEVAGLPETHRAHRQGLRVTSLSRTVVDCSRELPFRDALVLADSALRLFDLGKGDLEQVLKDCWPWPRIRRAARIVAFADAAAETVAESLARVVFLEQGLPTPELQCEIFDDRGFIGRVDFLFRKFNTVVEVDGRLKYDDGDPRVLWREKQREDRLREAGYEVVRITWADLMYRPEKVRARIEAAFARALRRR